MWSIYPAQAVGNLRRLVLQRTRLVEESQELLQRLRDMTTGTKAETQFMAVCVRTWRQYLNDDLVTPVLVVERLCTIIHPKKDDVELLSLRSNARQSMQQHGARFGAFDT